MDGARIATCPTCGKALNGVALDYSQRWQCSRCANDQTDVLHCERGSKVRAVALDTGFESDSKQAKKLLVEGQIYEVEKINIGGWISTIWLKEFPGEKFNTVHFERCE